LKPRADGGYFAFSGVEPVPDLEAYFRPLRSIYALSYQSEIVSSGEHRLSAVVDQGAFEAITTEQVFSLEILPPNPIFVSPPTQIFRSAVAEATNGQLSGLTPGGQDLEILIEFPDGYERELVRTTLYVNGEIAVENTSPPFDVFEWDITGIEESSRFNLQVEAVDILGLSSVSLPTPVDITVERLPEGFVPTITRSSPVLTAVIILFTGIILIVVLLLIGRRANPIRSLSTIRQRRQKEKDPVFQPVTENENGTPSRRLTRWASQIPNRLHWPNRAQQEEPFAYLEKLVEPDSLASLTPSAPIPIHTTETTVGGDPIQSTLVLEDNSVADLHARLKRDEYGQFSVTDQDTVAGTWVNFQPTNGRSVPIRHGDLIHIGRLGFRFKLQSDQQDPDPIILPDNDTTR
jgi:hypothetical protein